VEDSDIEKEEEGLQRRRRKENLRERDGSEADRQQRGKP
jgi:hypothetical protein